MNPASLLLPLGLGFAYFVAAIPAGIAAGVPVPLAALLAWAGYSAGAAVVLLAGTPLRDWLSRKFKIGERSNRPGIVRRVWDRWGLAGLGILAPVTLGPQAGSLLALALGSKPVPVFAAISLGVIPWCVGFSIVGSAIKN